ncbi:MAG: acyl-CoA thioesterase [Pseudomonadota bacterium]|nr:acyl-CoA thioesterase [Pseudomonadota bacterium]
MNLLFRFFWCWLSNISARQDMFDPGRQTYRVWLHDMGWRTHLPNFRFLSFMELGRFQHWRRIRHQLKRSPGIPLIAAQEMVYLRPVGLFSRLTLQTELLGWDHKYVVFRHDFYVGDTLVATGLVKEACVAKGKVIAPDDIFQAESPEDTARLQACWQALHAEIRRHSGSR